MRAHDQGASGAHGGVRVPLDVRDNKMDLAFEDLLDDLCSRFILNLPVEELQTVERLPDGCAEAS